LRKVDVAIMITATGWLAERVDRAFVAVKNLRASLWWPGSMWGFEHVARWIRNVTLYDPQHPGLREAAEKLIALVESGQAFANYEQHGLAAYNEEEVLAGLLAYYRHFREPRALAAARRMGRSLAENHPKLVGNHYYKSLAIWPLLDLAAETGDESFQAAAIAIAESQQLAVLQQREAHGAATAMILYGYVQLFERTGQRRYLDWALAIWEAVRARQFITGGLGECLMFTAAPSESDLHDETCQHSWWMLANLALWRVTGESRYHDQVERTFYNHFLFAQLHRGEDGGFCALGDVDQGFRGQHNYICCDNEGFFGLRELIRHAVTPTADGVSVNFLLPVEAEVNGLRVRIETNYPVTGTATIRITGDTSRKLVVRVPGIGVQQRDWTAGDVVRVEFPLPMRVETDNTGLGAKSVAVRVDGQELPAKRIGVFHGPVLAVMFRTGHGNQLNWVWNGDYPEALESNGGDAQDIAVSTTGGLARLRWREGAVRHDVRVLPGLPVTLDWCETGGTVGGVLRYATAKRTQNPRYGKIAFPYPFPAVTTRDDLRASNGFVAGGGSFSLAERLTDGGELPKTGTVRLSNGTLRAICHYDPATVARVVGQVRDDWAGIQFEPVGGELRRRLIFPLHDQPLSQDLTLQEWRAEIRATYEPATRRLELAGDVVEHTPVLIPKSSGLQAGQVAGAAVVAEYDDATLVARLAVPGVYCVTDRKPL